MSKAARSNREMIAHWRRIGPALDRIRRQELRQFNYEQQLPMIDALLQLACEQSLPRTTSGLVELERLLAKTRR
jgi:hypothetical protein